jgi:hypothetical protein
MKGWWDMLRKVTNSRKPRTRKKVVPTQKAVEVIVPDPPPPPAPEPEPAPTPVPGPPEPKPETVMARIAIQEATIGVQGLELLNRVNAEVGGLWATGTSGVPRQQLITAIREYLKDHV